MAAHVQSGRRPRPGLVPGRRGGVLRGRGLRAVPAIRFRDGRRAAGGRPRDAPGAPRAGPPGHGAPPANAGPLARRPARRLRRDGADGRLVSLRRCPRVPAHRAGDGARRVAALGRAACARPGRFPAAGERPGAPHRVRRPCVPLARGAAADRGAVLSRPAGVQRVEDGAVPAIVVAGRAADRLQRRSAALDLDGRRRRARCRTRCHGRGLARLEPRRRVDRVHASPEGRGRDPVLP